MILMAFGTLIGIVIGFALTLALLFIFILISMSRHAKLQFQDDCNCRPTGANNVIAFRNTAASASQ